MAGQGTTRPGLIDSTPDRWSVMRSLNKMIDAHPGNGRIDIYMSRSKRRELVDEVSRSTLVLPREPNQCGPQVIEKYRGCNITLLSDDAEPSVYVVAGGESL